MNNKIFSFGPVALTVTLTTNILNPPTTTGGVNGGSSAQYILISRFRIVNKAITAATCSFWKGLTGANLAGTEILANKLSIPANSYQDFQGLWRFDSTDFLVGGSDTAAALTIEGAGEIGVAG